MENQVTEKVAESGAMAFMEASFKGMASWVALSVELIAVVLIAVGAINALYHMLQGSKDPLNPFHRRKEAFLQFGSYLIIGLEFELAADIIRSAIAPTWNQIGQLAAIAVIRTFLNYFLEKDVREFVEQRKRDDKAETP